VTVEKGSRPSSGMIKVSLQHILCHDSMHVVAQERRRRGEAVVWFGLYRHALCIIGTRLLAS
jgi:hypothetical protein